MTAQTSRRRPTARAALSAAAAATALAALTGCGSSSATGDVAAPAQTAPAYPTQDVVAAIPADPALTAELPKSVRDRGTLNLGTTLTPGTSSLPHVGATPDGRAVGLDVDLREAVARVLGVRLRVGNGAFATIIPGVQNGRYDVGQDNFGVTKARERVVDFSTYLTDGQALLASASGDLKSATSLTDLCGLAVATTPGSTFQQILTANAPRCAAAGRKPYRVQYFADTGPILLGLANGKVDIYFGPTLSLRYDATHLSNVRFLGQVSSTPVGFVTGKNSGLAAPLRDAVNELIKRGDYARILAKWGVASSGIPTSAVNPPANL